MSKGVIMGTEWDLEKSLTFLIFVENIGPIIRFDFLNMESSSILLIAVVS